MQPSKAQKEFRGLKIKEHAVPTNLAKLETLQKMKAWREFHQKPLHSLKKSIHTSPERTTTQIIHSEQRSPYQKSAASPSPPRNPKPLHLSSLKP